MPGDVAPINVGVQIDQGRRDDGAITDEQFGDTTERGREGNCSVPRNRSERSQELHFARGSQLQ
jgi:hypothetical protein